MKSIFFSDFNSEEVREKVKRYEGMDKGHTSILFTLNDLLDIDNYYQLNGYQSRHNEVLNYAMTLYPDDHRLLILWISNLIQTGQGDRAEELINTLPPEFEKQSIELLLGLSLSRDDKEEASILADEIYLKNDDKFEAVKTIINYYVLSFHAHWAEEWINLLLKEPKSQTDTDEVDYLLSLYYTQTEDQDKALACQKSILDRDPNDPDRWVGMADLYRSFHQEKEAYHYIDYALAIDNADLGALKSKALIDMEFHHYENAADTYKKLLALDHSLETMQQLHSCYTENLLDYEGASHICLDFLKNLSPEDLVTRFEVQKMLDNDYKILKGYNYIDAQMNTKTRSLDSSLLCMSCYESVVEGEDSTQSLQILKQNTMSTQEQKEKGYIKFMDMFMTLKPTPDYAKCCELFLQDLDGKSDELQLRICELYLDLGDEEGFMKHYLEPYYLNHKKYRKEDVKNPRYQKYFNKIAEMEQKGVMPSDFHFFVKKK